MKSTTLGLAACLAAGLAGACWAQDLKAKHTDTALGFESGSGYRNFTLAVTGPNGFHARATSPDSSPETVPSIDLREAGAREDGVYTYQVTASTSEKVPLRTKLDNGRSAAATEMLKSVFVSGQVHLKNGMIQKFAATAENEGEKSKRPQRERK